jgi:hypothetical protein
VVSSGPPGVGVNRPPATPTHGGAWSSSSSDSQHTRAGHYGQRTDYTGEGLWQSTRRPDVNPHRPTLDVIDPGDGVVSSPGVAGRRPAVLDEIQQATSARARAPVAPPSQQDMLGTYAGKVLAPTAPEGQAPAGWGTSSSGLESSDEPASEEPAQTWTDEEVRDAPTPTDVVERAFNQLMNSPPPDGWTEEAWMAHLRSILGKRTSEQMIADWLDAIGTDDVNGGAGYSADDLARAFANGWILVDAPGSEGWRWQRIEDPLIRDGGELLEAAREGREPPSYRDPSDPGSWSLVTGTTSGQRAPGEPAPEDEIDLDALFEQGRAELDAIDARANATREAAIAAAQRERAMQLSRALRVANMIGASNNMPAEAVFGSMAEMGRATGLSGATEDSRTRLEGELQSAQREWDFWRQRVEIANAQQNRQAAEASARYALAAQERLMRLQDSLSTPTAGEAALSVFGSLLGSAGTGAGYALGAKLFGP